MPTELVKIWQERAKTQGWKPKSATYHKMALEFFLGARAGGAQINDMQLVLLSLGRLESITKEQ